MRLSLNLPRSHTHSYHQQNSLNVIFILQPSPPPPHNASANLVIFSSFCQLALLMAV